MSGRVSVIVSCMEIMDDFHRIFDIDSQHRVLICRPCQYAIIPSHVKTHLNTHHRRLSVQQRARLVSEVGRSTKLAKIHADVIYPSPIDPPITSLPLLFAWGGTGSSQRDVGGSHPTQRVRYLLLRHTRPT